MKNDQMRQPFESYPALAAEIQRMASTGTVGSLSEWQDFTDALNAALGRWQDISTAPTDGSPILGWSDEGVSYVCWYSKGRWTFLKNYKGDEWHFDPTKWMPHPALPTLAVSE